VGRNDDSWGFTVISVIGYLYIGISILFYPTILGMYLIYKSEDNICLYTYDSYFEFYLVFKVLFFGWAPFAYCFLNRSERWARVGIYSFFCLWYFAYAIYGSSFHSKYNLDDNICLNSKKQSKTTLLP
jgi:hypothetical protein